MKPAEARACTLVGEPQTEVLDRIAVAGMGASPVLVGAMGK
jgi:hypothetical protein